MIRKLSLAAAILAIGALSFTRTARAGDPAPAAAPAAEPAPVAPAKAEAPKTAEAVRPETKTPSPVLSVMFWLGHQVAPNLDCACPATSAEGEKAWRDWFAGGKDVPQAAIRDALVADGWTADRFVTFFKDMVAKKNAAGACSGACTGGKCGDATKAPADASGGKDCGGACHGKGGGTGCPGCPGSKDAAPAPETPKTDSPAKP